MIVLGVILILLAVAAGLVLFAGTSQLTDTVDIDVLGGTLSFPPLALLITGMVVITLFWLGWVLLRTGTKRNRRQRAQAKEAAREAETKRIEDEKRTKEEFAARERQLVEERRRHEDERAALLKEADDRAAARSDQPATDPAPAPTAPSTTSADSTDNGTTGNPPTSNATAGDTGSTSRTATTSGSSEPTEPGSPRA